MSKPLEILAAIREMKVNPRGPSKKELVYDTDRKQFVVADAGTVDPDRQPKVKLEDMKAF